MVLYNPPYYNIEIYTGQSIKKRDDWNHFYKDLCDISWRHLQKGGWYCVAVSNEIYDVYCAAIGRVADFILPLPNQKRNTFHKYGECVFCWRKG